jgi:hypothetical protein
MKHGDLERMQPDKRSGPKSLKIMFLLAYLDALGLSQTREWCLERPKFELKARRSRDASTERARPRGGGTPANDPFFLTKMLP